MREIDIDEDYLVEELDEQTEEEDFNEDALLDADEIAGWEEGFMKGHKAA